MRAFLRILLFIAVGPAIGTLAMLLTTGFVGLARSGRPDDLLFLFSRWRDNLEIMEFGYVMGGVPALVAGIVASILPRFMPVGWRYVGWVTLSGAVASALVIFAFLVPSFAGINPPSDWGNALSFLGMMGWIGGVAAFGCTLLFEGLSKARSRTRVPA
jgi:hypothetical protein